MQGDRDTMHVESRSENRNHIVSRRFGAKSLHSFSFQFTTNQQLEGRL
jgi:hypothetical protein